jgi:hypothetical protein
MYADPMKVYLQMHVNTMRIFFTNACKDNEVFFLQMHVETMKVLFNKCMQRQWRFCLTNVCRHNDGLFTNACRHNEDFFYKCM